MSDEKMHMVGCHIELGGDKHTIVVRDAHNPVSWPEVAVLQHLHGEDSVHTFEVVDAVDKPRPSEEKKRLVAKYGAEVHDVFPGNSPNFEWTMPGVTFEPKAVEPEPVDPVPEPETGPAPADAFSDAQQPGEVEDPAAAPKRRRIAVGVETE